VRIYLASCTSLALLASAAAQNATPLGVKTRTHPATQVHTEARPNELPITRVALYKNGVGFFEHSGRVTGDQSVTIDFTSAQLNDVLQSLTAIDLGGGRISGAGYNSTTPFEQQLKTLPLALSDDPSDYDFYNAIRGARVQASGPGISVTGRLLSIDLRPSPPKGSDADSPDKPNRRFLTVISDSGQVHTFELTSAVTVTLLDSTLHTDVTRYLELLASTRNQGLRHLTLLDRGTGSRDLRVSYISEVPVWKSTYRILFKDAKAASATLQGWSVVDNTTGSDWTNVHLDLIAGAPQSFIQPISTPYYTRRPEIPLPTEAQLEPQTHESGDSEPLLTLSAPTKIPQDERFVAKKMIPNKAARVTGMAGGSAGGVMGGIGLGLGGNMGGGMPAAPPPPPLDYAEAASASLTPQTTTAAFDDYFEYTLTDPITIRKNESALVPILQTKLPIERVTLWSAQQPVALRALWITNSSTLTLDRGSFSIVENGSFGGEGLLDPIHPGERRLLSYAADQAVTVDSGRSTAGKHHLRNITVAKGILTEHYRDVNLRDYAVRNASAEPRTILIEHPITQGFQLQNPGGSGPEDTSLKPEETTPSLYRFRLTVPAHETAHLKIAETRFYPRTIQVGGINDNQVRVLLQELGTDNPSNSALMQQLQPVLDAQRRIADLMQKKSGIDGQLNRLRAEEERQRANIVALKDTDKTAQKRFIDELGRIEDQILDQQKQLESLEKDIQSAQQDLSNKVQTVQFNQSLEP
jgi:hypothetical protein